MFFGYSFCFAKLVFGQLASRSKARFLVTRFAVQNSFIWLALLRKACVLRANLC